MKTRWLRTDFIFLLLFNLMVTTAAVGTYRLVASRMGNAVATSSSEGNQQKVDLIAKSLRQAALTRDYTAVRRILMGVLKDKSIVMMHWIPSDGSEGICVGQDKSCTPGAQDQKAPLFRSNLWFDEETREPLGELVSAIESPELDAIKGVLSRELAVALLGLVLVFNVVLLFFFRALSKQIQWSIQAIRNLSKGSKTNYTGTIYFWEKERLTSSIRELERVLTDYQAVIERSSRESGMVEIAQQVAHDIRSPLSALALIGPDLRTLPEESRLIAKAAVTRMNEIANSLLASVRVQNRDRFEGSGHSSDQSSWLRLGGAQKAVEPCQPSALSLLIDSAVAEKSLIARMRPGVEFSWGITCDSLALFSKIQPVEFKRILSNLIDNSLEALGSKGEVSLKLTQFGNCARLEILDNGKGIPKEVLSSLGRKGATYGKEQGTGLGLYHAIQRVKGWGGDLRIYSTEGVGTTVILELPLTSVPKTFAHQLVLESNSSVFTLDDDRSIHALCSMRFSQLNPTQGLVKLSQCSSAEEFILLLSREVPTPLSKTGKLFLIDQEIRGSNTTGLEIIERLGIEKQSVLVTGSYEDPDVLDRCARLRVRLLPKPWLSVVPIILGEMPLRSSSGGQALEAPGLSLLPLSKAAEEPPTLDLARHTESASLAT